MIALTSSVRVVAVVAVLGLASGCMTDDSGRPTNQATGTVVGATVGSVVGGLAFGWGGALGGAVVGGLAGNLVGRSLDDQERRRLAEATQRAYASTAMSRSSTRSSRPRPRRARRPRRRRPSCPPSLWGRGLIVPTAAPAGRSSSTATKNGQTTRETTTFCQSAGSTELKPVSV